MPDAMHKVEGLVSFSVSPSYLCQISQIKRNLIEPRSDYLGPLMTGDCIIEVNGEDVEDVLHETVVDMIKASGECVNLRVASMPKLVELNNRGGLDQAFERNTGLRKSGKAKQGTGECVCCPRL